MNLYTETRSLTGLTRRYWFEIKSGNNTRRGISIGHLSQDNDLIVSASTTIGCPYACKFCAQGRQEPLPLRADQITGQVNAILKDFGPVGLAGVRFDVSGEPLANWLQVKEAIKQLSREHNNPPMLVVSAAPKSRWYPEIFELGRELGNITLQFSVHASTETERSERFQEDRLLSLAEIGHKGSEWVRTTGRRCVFAYALDGLANATPLAAQKLGELFPPEFWECQITPTYMAALTGAQALGVNQLALFQQELEKLGFTVTVYAPLDGLGIRAVPGLD
jgi:adenine C2-methylase RlmN of 23S rRNA A2503 and tRNA A37